MTDEIREVLKERGSRYGDFKDHAFITQQMKAIWHLSEGHIRLSGEDDHTGCVINEGLEMVFHKLGRICNGDPLYIDSWVDIIGYCQLVVDHLRKLEDEEQRKNEKQIFEDL